MHPRIPLACLLAAGLAAALGGAAADEPKADAGPLTVIDAAGKEHKLKSYRFSQGTRRLAFLAPKDEPGKDPEVKPGDPKDGRGKAAPKGKPAAGPVALELREESSTRFVNGILTLIPLEHLRGLEFDNDKQKVTAKVATGPKDDDVATLAGETRFQGINKVAIEAEVDKGDMGVAEIKFLGGVAKGVKELRFAAAKAEAMPPGRPAKVTIADGKKTVLEATDLQALYRGGDGAEKLSPTLMFKKTLKIDIGKVKKLSVSTEGEDKAVTVAFKDGEEQTLTPLLTVTLDGKEMELEGLLGRVPGGYKLFPLHTIVEVELDAGK